MEQENLRTIHQVYEDFGRGDVAAVLATLTEDVQWFTPGPPDISRMLVYEVVVNR